MEKLKAFFSDTKKLAILGLISSITAPIFCLVPYWSFGPITLIYAIIMLLNSCNLGFFIYFLILLMRLYKKKGSIKLANLILFFGLIISSVYSFFGDSILAFTSIINVIYIYNILFKQGKIRFITNKVFLILNIIIVILDLTIR